METIANASNFLTNETFNAEKEIYKKSLNDKLNYQPCSLADTNILLRDTNWEPKHLIAVLDGLKLETLQGFYADFMSRIKMEWFLYGNIDEMV
jgi:secreted Zn-dependent insulinase-like peptidase